MPRKTNENNQINSNTQIVFNIKGFFGLLGSMLALFFGFYMLVVVPKINATEKHYSDMFEDQKEQNKLFYQELGKINTSIGSLSATIEAMNKTASSPRNTIANSSGSIGNNTGSTQTTNSNELVFADGN